VIGFVDLGKGRTENEWMLSEEDSHLLTLFLKEQQQEIINNNF
jgi:hypothetical protein